MDDKKYFKLLADMPGSRMNDIIHAVNCKVPKASAGLKSDIDKMFYDRLWAQAMAHLKKYGDWPVFDMCEVDTNDPRIDIYGGK